MKVKPCQTPKTNGNREMSDAVTAFAKPTTDELAVYLEEARKQGLNAQLEYDNSLRATEPDLKLILC